MRKNLILLHLESISNTILWQYRVELATIWRLMQQSFSYSRFYSSSVSTDTVLEELSNGCADSFDGATLFNKRWEQSANNPKYNSFITFAGLAGYNYFRFIENPFAPPYAKWPDYSHPDFDMLLQGAKERLKSLSTSDRPFIFRYRVVVSHMAYDDSVKIQAKTFSERFRLGYLRQDQAINTILSALIEYGLWENSIIVCYGDHGDELWSHGLNRGYCHAIIPYASLCSVPMFIYEHGVPPGTSDRLISTIDLRESLIKRLIPDFDPSQVNLHDLFGGPPPEGWPRDAMPPFRETPFNGIDAFNEKRELAFTNNLFALQLEYSDLEAGLTKGYSVTDGTYRVVVSSGGTNPKNGGLEFFCDRLDPFNSRNLLDFFKLDGNGDIKEFYPPPEAFVREFSLIFNEKAVEHLKAVYGKLKSSLHEYVRDREQQGMKLTKESKYHVMPESVFKHSRKRLFQDVC